ncbi:MAG TPA: hypothetical protein VGF06_06280 [Terriglobales bacterium]|jgi:hypothetical protein
MGRWLKWVSGETAQGWACSQCAWIFTSPDLLSGDPEAKAAYDRLASSKFQAHHCEEFGQQPGLAEEEDFMTRARNLVKRGFKPRDAADITMQEIMLESGDDPKTAARTRVAAEEFLRRVKAGII